MRLRVNERKETKNDEARRRDADGRKCAKRKDKEKRDGKKDIAESDKRGSGPGDTDGACPVAHGPAARDRGGPIRGDEGRIPTS